MANKTLIGLIPIIDQLKKTSITLDEWSVQEKKTFADGLMVIRSKIF